MRGVGALVDAVEYKLLKDGAEPPPAEWAATVEEDFDAETRCEISNFKFEISNS